MSDRRTPCKCCLVYLGPPFTKLAWQCQICHFRKNNNILFFFCHNCPNHFLRLPKALRPHRERREGTKLVYTTKSTKPPVLGGASHPPFTPWAMIMSPAFAPTLSQTVNVRLKLLLFVVLAGG